MISWNAGTRFALYAGCVLLLTAGQGVAEDGAKKPAANAVGSGWSAEVAPSGETSVTLDASQTEAVNTVTKYFNDLKTLQGQFIQTDADAKVMRGDFKMAQPGRFRFDYNRPSRQIIISDGTYLAIQDLDLANEDRISLDQTPFRMLLKADVDLMRDAQIVGVQQSEDHITLALRDKNPDAAGVIKLRLKTQPEVALDEWVTTDPQGLDTRVQVGNLKVDEPIDDSAFVIKSVAKPFDQ